ncbi:MAG: hypothetical protein GTN74_03375 [Proteobacteria bacterium]|nr:hypothetical protein [Pseudomonadota bacterium]NIS68265.1 hypothetical protein [Pseudomonadota bacterium]
MGFPAEVACPSNLSGLTDFDLSRGFLPSEDPLMRLPGSFDKWEEIAGNLPKILTTDKIRQVVESLPPFETSELVEKREFERAMVILSYLGHAYVWGAPNPPNRIPRQLAVPWYEVSRQLGRPPVLSYSSYALNNWRRFDPGGPIALGNISLIQNFLGGLDEEWFILIHVDIEAKAQPALSSIVSAQEAVRSGHISALEGYLTTTASSLNLMCQTLDRMPENCDPYIYYTRVRPYIHGWKDNPGLPEGLLYEGVQAYREKPQKFRGETGAQSSIIPSLDAALGIDHKDDPLRAYLMEMRDYMPPKHREFIQTIEQGPSIRVFVIENREHHPGLRESYNRCVRLIERFRARHLEYAGRYIQKQSQHHPSNPTEVGTGGTPFMVYLKKHRDETSTHLI